ncbi:cleavage polyadenylation factor subunit fip1 [Spiromyces aspiralis]|uniref:Cleavage polyadenylation factor subunit fip1 n=1 Tax=Spiromyces aspiralis TaxID=68401 RepID=A0ACC1HU11_9FUNG|nr:cleavage polyadenylation factor subunit fip1 [Spiromyces aspiralis]
MLTVPTIKDIDLYEFDIDTLEEKGWRKPGADISDYFNFGFTEKTWKLYCLKQKQLRTDFNTRTMINAMGGREDKLDLPTELRALGSGMSSILGGPMSTLPPTQNLPAIPGISGPINPEMLMRRSQMMMGPTGMPAMPPPFFPNAMPRPSAPHHVQTSQAVDPAAMRATQPGLMGAQSADEQKGQTQSDSVAGPQKLSQGSPKLTETPQQPASSTQPQMPLQFPPKASGAGQSQMPVPPFFPPGFNPNMPGAAMMGRPPAQPTVSMSREASFSAHDGRRSRADSEDESEHDDRHKRDKRSRSRGQSRHDYYHDDIDGDDSSSRSGRERDRNRRVVLGKATPQPLKFR